MSNITSANAVLRFVVPGIYPGGFTAEDFAADAMFTVDSVTNKETLMTADGRFHAGFVFNEAPITINFSPTSPTVAYLDQWTSIEKTTISSIPCNATLSIPALDGTWNLVNGYLMTWAPAPSAGKVLQPRQAVFHFQNITPA